MLILLIAEPHSKLQLSFFLTQLFVFLGVIIVLLFGLFSIYLLTLSTPDSLTEPSIFSRLVQTQEVTYFSCFPLELSLPEPSVTLLFSGALPPCCDPGICIYPQPGDSLHLSSAVILCLPNSMSFPFLILGYIKKGSMGS